MRGRSASKAAHNSASGRRRSSGIGSKRQKHGAIGEVGPRHDVLDAVQDHRPGRVEQHLVLIGVKLAHREAAARREPTERVGNPRRQARHVVESEHVAVGGGDEEVAVLARQSAQGRRVGIEQRPQDRREGGLRRSLLARQHEHRIGTLIAQDGQRPCDHQNEVRVGLHVEERIATSRSIRPARAPAAASCPTARRNRTGGLSTTRQPVGVDLHRAPSLIAEIEVELAVQPADADMDRAFRRIEMSLSLDHVQRRLQRLRTWRALRRLEEAARQPATESLGSDRPGLAVAVDVEIGEAGPVRGVEQVGRLREIDQDVGLRRTAAASVAVFLGDSFVERRHPAAGFLELRPQRLESGAIVLLQRRKPFQDLRRERSAGIVAVFSTSPSSGSRISSAASMAAAIRFFGFRRDDRVSLCALLDARARGPSACR